MRRHALAIGLAVLAFACDRPDERTAADRVAEAPAPGEIAVAGPQRPEVGARRLAVVARLTDLLEPHERSLAGRRCPIDAERRPALGCTRWEVVHERRIAPGEPPAPVVLADAGPRPRMLQWAVRGPGRVFDTPRAATIAAAGATTLAVDPAAIAGADAGPGLRVTLRERPTLPERVRTSTVTVPPDARLEFGLAIDPTMPHDGVEAVTFVLAAETPAGERVLFESRLAPDDPAAARWTEHRIALDALAGSPVRFVFTTRLVARADAEPSRVAALPLWGAPEILAPSDDPAPAVILISFDTLRADHLGAYGSTLPTSPHLDRLAAEGVVFDDVFAPFPSTTASHMSMLTGLYPIAHGVLTVGQPLRHDVPSLATLLGDRGWRTAAVTENGMLRADLGFSNGVSFYRELTEVEDASTESRFASSTFDAAIRWIDAHADERFFLFIHTYVVHWPYKPPAEYDLFKTAHRAPPAGPPSEPRDFEPLRRSYAGEVRYADALFGRLRAELARLGLARRTLVVVTSDHGEEFGEHGSWSHSRQLYDEVLHVPLLVWAPETLGVPRRVPGPASLVDVVPTVLDAVDVPVPEGLHGRSLLAGAPSPDRAVFADVQVDAGRRVMARTRDAKWVWNPKGGAVIEAFDLAADPGEHRPVADPAFHARGEQFLADYLAFVDTMPAPTAAPDLPGDPATAEKLRALGYVE